MNSSTNSPWAQDGRLTDKNGVDPKKRAAVHAFLYSKSTAVLFGKIDMRYGVMMALRFDGKLGFPGGLLEQNENCVCGLNRELHEEIGMNERLFLDEDNYFCSWDNPERVNHFYIKEYNQEDFHEIETNAMKSRDWGGETLGIIRVPLQKPFHTKGPKRNPLAEFFKHNFVSNSCEQLIEGIIKEGIFSREEMVSTWTESRT